MVRDVLLTPIMMGLGSKLVICGATVTPCVPVMGALTQLSPLAGWYDKVFFPEPVAAPGATVCNLGNTSVATAVSLVCAPKA
jgi:hypothetical protein